MLPTVGAACPSIAGWHFCLGKAVPRVLPICRVFWHLAACPMLPATPSPVVACAAQGTPGRGGQSRGLAAGSCSSFLPALLVLLPGPHQ